MCSSSTETPPFTYGVGWCLSNFTIPVDRESWSLAMAAMLSTVALVVVGAPDNVEALQKLVVTQVAFRCVRWRRNELPAPRRPHHRARLFCHEIILREKRESERERERVCVCVCLKPRQPHKDIGREASSHRIVPGLRRIVCLCGPEEQRRSRLPFCGATDCGVHALRHPDILQGACTPLLVRIGCVARRHSLPA